VVGAPQQQANGTFTGQVRRRVLAPAVGGQPQQVMRSGTVNVVFDPNTCTVQLPFAINFVGARTSGTRGICDSSPATVATPAPRVAQVAREAVQTMQDGLNGWYAVRVEGCQHPCAGRDIPIVVNVSQSATNPDATVNVVNRSGSADSGNLCAAGFNEGTTLHEGGHGAFELIDEYRERRARVRRRNPARSRNERVRTDFSQMGSHHTYGRLAVFHERHFRFAQVFVEAVMANAACGVSLSSVRGPPLERRLTLGTGNFDSDRGGRQYLQLGADLARPFDASRRFNLEGGLRAQLLIAPPDQRDAVLLGARLGLSAQTHPANWSLNANVFAGGGISVLPSRALYGEVGGKIGFGSSMSDSRRIGFELEAALGRIFADDPEGLHYSRVGVNAFFSW